ncbi:MAG: POTRA domain-containing protein [Bryobacteraceae bacterium]|jgi:outer membrane protein insertion porin family
MMRSLHAAMAFLLTPAALAQHPVMEIHVAGNDRLAAAAVIAASGLRKGQVVTRAQLDAAAQRLADTGFFASVSYGYDPKTAGGVTGYALTFQVSEQPALARVELDIPGMDSERLWQQLKSADGLIDKQMPNNDRASAYYKRVIEAVLRKSNYAEEIVLKNEGNLSTGKTWVAFRPAHLPKIAAIRFEGNAAIADGALQAAMAKVAMGQEYTERDFRRMLELNVRPLYEELGHLTVAFPRVAMNAAGDAAVAVTAAIDEGPAWRLGKVALTGDSLPLADMHEAARFAYGDPANWKQFSLAVDKMEQVLRRDGYITVSSQPVRSFHDTTQTVDVTVQVKKGPQFRFGALHIEGLDAATEKRLAALWTLPTGAPMNQPYVEEFVRSALPVLRGRSKTLGSEMHVHQGENVVDVTIKFR